MTKKHQASLTSFFGSPSKSKPKSKSKPAKPTTTSTIEDDHVANDNDKNNNNTSNGTKDAEGEVDVEMSSITGKPIRSKKNKNAKKRQVGNGNKNKDMIENTNTSSNTKPSSRPKAKKAKLVIQDDDDDDNNDVEMKEVNQTTKKEVKEDDEDDDDEDVALESLKPKKNSKKPKTNSTTTSSSPSPKSNSKSKSNSSSTLKSKQLPQSNETLKGDNNTPIPYSTLTETLSSIEAITGRLEIQSHLTKLFSQCLLSYPQDLLTLVYLSSNSVAPAYECVELGIGDAILIKAIGEANGSNPTVIKQKYEADGDLGTVAMNAKGKQRTLGFGKKPKPLMAKEVLDVYRKIASITGSQSQKTKVDMIKGLLVRATQKGNESKYIIRGLQGKLRIGLAQSTVLISLAHAILKSCSFNQGPCKKLDLDDDDDDVDEDNDNGDEKGNFKPKTQNDKPDELSSDCRIVKNTRLALDTRLESAVNIVKKAYSEVSSFDALVESLISTPLWELHKTCTLRPGFPVTPMLAKPTKSIQEVLKRLSGKRFTCEYKYDGERAQVHMQDDGLTKVC